MRPSQPLPLDRVCPACGELVRRIRATRNGPLVWTCPSKHEAGEPITYRHWLALVAAESADEGGKP